MHVCDVFVRVCVSVCVCVGVGGGGEFPVPELKFPYPYQGGVGSIGLPACYKLLERNTCRLVA